MMAGMTLKSSFIAGTPRPHFSCECDRQSQSRLVARASSTAYDSNSQNQKTELKSSVEEGGVQTILNNSSPKRNWWAPVFNFSPEGVWSSALPEAEKQIDERVPVTIPRPAAEMISSPDRTASSAMIGRESSSLSDLIASSQQNPRSGTKHSIFDDKKARELRRKMRVHETWHDGWVHSAIATRLAEPED